MPISDGTALLKAIRVQPKGLLLVLKMRHLYSEISNSRLLMGILLTIFKQNHHIHELRERFDHHHSAHFVPEYNRCDGSLRNYTNNFSMVVHACLKMSMRDVGMVSSFVGKNRLYLPTFKQFLIHQFLTNILDCR